jgi:hypothetical protein
VNIDVYSKIINDLKQQKSDYAATFLLMSSLNSILGEFKKPAAWPPQGQIFAARGIPERRKKNISVVVTRSTISELILASRVGFAHGIVTSSGRTCRRSSMAKKEFLLLTR